MLGKHAIEKQGKYTKSVLTRKRGNKIKLASLAARVWEDGFGGVWTPEVKSGWAVCGFGVEKGEIALLHGNPDCEPLIFSSLTLVLNIGCHRAFQILQTRVCLNLYIFHLIL